MNRYFMLSLVCLAVSTIPFTCGFPAQKSRVTVLFKHRNLPQAGDSIIKQQVAYVDPGAAGQDITWDFSTVQPVNDSYNVRYQALSPDTSVIGGIEHRTLYRYGVQGDTLMHTGYENATTQMNYTLPELTMRYPFRYGDTISSNFAGTGEYCHRIPLQVSGTTTVTADGTGTLDTPLGLKFKNALRVKSIRQYTRTGMDSVVMRLETYAWYVWGNRYPVFETIKTATQKNGGEETEHQVASFFFPPENQTALQTDTTNWEQDKAGVSPPTIDDIFTTCRLLPNPVQSELEIEYVLTQDATISFSVHDQLGVAQIITPPRVETAGQYTQAVPMGNFHTGVYPLYVMVNGMVKKLNVVKQ
jgi:hypothetical protein